MFSIPYIGAQLIKTETQKELQQKIEPIFGMRAFDTQSWQEAKREDLENFEVQQRLIKTLFVLQDNYEGVGGEIMRSLEEWSDGTILFKDFSAENQDFCQRYYAFLGFVIFDSLKFSSQMYLLGSRFLLFACYWDIPVYVNVQRHFIDYTYIHILDAHALAFAEAMAQNQTLFGEPGKRQLSVGQWIDLFEKFDGSSSMKRIEEFMSENMEAKRLAEDNRRVLEKILTLYWGLQGGFIYLEVEDIFPPDGYVPKEKREYKSVGDYYLQMLFQADKDSFAEWLDTSGDAAYWMHSTRKSSNFIKKLVYIIYEKLDLGNAGQVNQVINFFNILETLGYSGLEDLIYYDEPNQQFKWSEPVLFSLRPEPEKPPKAEEEPETVFMT